MQAERASGTGTWTIVEGRLADGLPMRVYLAAHQGDLLGASVHDDVHPRSEDEFLWGLGPFLQWKKSDEGLSGAAGQIREYFAGHRRSLDIAVRFRGTEFQKRVWLHLQRIPFGETISYGELAEMIGHPGAFRAVGSANGKNSFGLVVPCHRVIAAGGKLGGYTGGLGVKSRLLAHEAAILKRCAG